MRGANQIIGPASETYAGYAWEYLRRNKDYCQLFSAFEDEPLKPKLHMGATYRYEHMRDKAAHQWQLECFEAPASAGLEASVIWRQEAFPGGLFAQFHAKGEEPAGDETYNFYDLSCEKQHFIKTDGTRITVLKSSRFWLQISGKPLKAESEEEAFSIIISGAKGARRRIDALRQLTSLTRSGIEDFALNGRRKAFAKMRNGLKAYDIKQAGGSYKDIAIALFGGLDVEQNWGPEGGFLKQRAARSYRFGERMVAQDYRDLLPKKTI